jgi:hypothetical protein
MEGMLFFVVECVSAGALEGQAAVVCFVSRMYV